MTQYLQTCSPRYHARELQARSISSLRIFHDSDTHTSDYPHRLQFLYPSTLTTTIVLFLSRLPIFLRQSPKMYVKKK